MPDTAHDSYELRARLLKQYVDFATTLVSKYLSSFFIPNILFISDHYLASQAYYRRGIETSAQYSYKSAHLLHYQLEDISVAGRDADQYELEEIAAIGKQRNSDLFKTMLPLGISGKYNVGDKEYIDFLKRLKF
jgi:hypothetical protein